MKAKREKEMMSSEELSEATEFLKAMAHPQRLRILQLLIHQRHTVGELATACDIPAPVASAQLRLLERCGLLAGKRDGKFVYYEIAEPQLLNIMLCLESRFRH